MSLKVDKLKLNETQDRRRKLSDEQKKEIYHLYNNIGGYSLNMLAKQYQVSKKTILIIVNEDSKKKNDEHIKNNWKKYYDKEKHRKAIQKTRQYKKQLLVKGEI